MFKNIYLNSNVMENGYKVNLRKLIDRNCTDRFYNQTVFTLLSNYPTICDFFYFCKRGR